MQPPDTHDEDPPNPRHSIDPLVSALPLSTPNRRGGLQPYQAPFKGSIDRPVFGPEHLRPLSEVVPTSVPFLDTATQMQQAQERRERQAQADRERLASMPTAEDLQARRIAALEADQNALRVTVATLEKRLAQLEAPRMRGRSRHPDDRTPPEAA